MLSKLVEYGINLDSKGADWLLCILEEAAYCRDRAEKFSVRRYLLGLNCTEIEIKAAYASISKALKDARYNGTMTQFIQNCLD